MTIRATRRRTVAVVLAGGTGQRIGLAIPKQLLKIAGKPILEHTLHIFENAPDIDDVIVLMTPDHVPAAEKIVARAGLGKVSRVLAGGSTRSETTNIAIQAVADRLGDGEDCNLLFHDAVRPLLSQRVVKECVEALERYRAVDVAIPSADTVIVTRTHGDDGEFITEVPDRGRLRRGQTPQGFRLSTIRDAYERAAADPLFRATDDCSVVVKYLPDVPVHVVMGDEYNMKVTQPVDVFIADKLFQLASTTAPAPGDEQVYRDRLAGRTLLVFGGAHGTGADIARIAEEYGARVHTPDRSTTGTDVASPEQVDEAFARAYAETGRIDYVVNAAGVLPVGRLDETDIATVREALRINYLAPVNIARSAYKYLAESQGQLLLFTAGSYTRGRAEYSLYSSTKAAMVNLTQALSEEWAEDGIRVNCVNPGIQLPSERVARSSLDVLFADLTGHVIDVREQDPAAPIARSSGFEQAIASVLSEGVDTGL
ncbi:SDR family oxidoreductase [Streptomyces sp. LN785]|uniref:SDR family oxidoreductase n=1 Tax=Streptomyces sp. LN785 TaxID=3112983 RepID=UPI003717878B